MNAAVQMPFSSTPHYETGVNFCKQNIHKALEKYSDPVKLLRSSSAFQLPQFSNWKKPNTHKKKPTREQNQEKHPNKEHKHTLKKKKQHKVNWEIILTAWNFHCSTHWWWWLALWWNAEGKMSPHPTFKLWMCLQWVFWLGHGTATVVQWLHYSLDLEVYSFPVRTFSSRDGKECIAKV